MISSTSLFLGQLVYLMKCRRQDTKTSLFIHPDLFAAPTDRGGASTVEYVFLEVFSNCVDGCAHCY